MNNTVATPDVSTFNTWNFIVVTVVGPVVPDTHPHAWNSQMPTGISTWPGTPVTVKYSSIVTFPSANTNDCDSSTSTPETGTRVSFSLSVVIVTVAGPSPVRAWIVANVNVEAETAVTTNVPLFAGVANPVVLIFWPVVKLSAVKDPDERVIVSGFEFTAVNDPVTDGVVKSDAMLS